MHVLYWVALRPRERAALWIGFSFLGFASLDVLIAATSVAASGALGPASVYSPLVLASSLTLPFLLLSAWGVFGKPVTGVRRFLLLLSLVVLGLTYADFGFWAPS